MAEAKAGNIPQKPQENSGNKVPRKPKQGNTELFNELLSGANALSVSERTRLVKSLAGQLNLVVVGSGELLAKENPKAKKQDGANPAKPDVRPNPLKGTLFEQEKNEAYKALVQAKAAAQGAKLPESAPEVLRYAQALANYKAEHKRLDPVGGNPTASKPKASKPKARTTTERSPEPAAASKASRTGNLIGRVASAVRKASTSTPSNAASAMEEDI